MELVTDLEDLLIRQLNGKTLIDVQVSLKTPKKKNDIVVLTLYSL